MTYQQISTNPVDRWQFRWRFDFYDSRGTKTGGWYPATRVEDMASSVNKSNLAYAMIEGKHWGTKETKLFAVTEGRKFINFRHLSMAIVSSRLSFGVGISKGTTIHRVYGMVMSTIDQDIIVYETGAIDYRKPSYNAITMPEWTRF